MTKAFAAHQIVLADYGEMPNFLSSSYTFISLGEKNEDTIAHTLLNYCLNEEIDLILPLHTFEIVAVAKAKVLFSEFNVDSILPADVDLPSYFNAKGNQKFVQWSLFRNGDALFMSSANERLVEFAKTANLSGAFYFNDASTVANLTLITI
jgi:hypothetical protein